MNLDFETLRITNKNRCENELHPLNSWLPSQWSNAMAGEVGETCNLTKKMDRLLDPKMKRNMNKTSDMKMIKLIERAGGEIGDIVIYADLLASRLGLKLADCVRISFNNKSDELELPNYKL